MTLAPTAADTLFTTLLAPPRRRPVSVLLVARWSRSTVMLAAISSPRVLEERAGHSGDEGGVVGADRVGAAAAVQRCARGQRGAQADCVVAAATDEFERAGVGGLPAWIRVPPVVWADASMVVMFLFSEKP